MTDRECQNAVMKANVPPASSPRPWDVTRTMAAKARYAEALPGIQGLLEDPTIDWKHPAITTYGENMFSLRSWPVGDTFAIPMVREELYDHSLDPHEFNNKASQPELESMKAKFRTFIPQTFKKSLGGRNG